jgi:hypothetical protein
VVHCIPSTFYKSSTQSESIYLHNISHLEKANTLGIIPNGIKVFTKDNQSLRFIVYKRNKLIQEIELLIKK